MEYRIAIAPGTDEWGGARFSDLLTEGLVG